MSNDSGNAHGAGDMLRQVLPWLVCSALSGLLVFLSFPPVDLWPLAFVALTPLLISIDRAPSYGWAALFGATAGVFAYLPAFAWVASVAVSGWVVLALYVGLYLVAAAVAVRFLQRSFTLSWPVLAAAAWVGLELFRAHLGPGFPWLFLGHTQYRFAGLLQLAALGGVCAVSFVVFLVGACVAALVITLFGTSPRERRALPVRQCLMLTASVCLLMASAAAGHMVKQRVPMEEGLVVGVIQQNIPRRVADIYPSPRTDEEARRLEVKAYRAMEDELQKAALLTAALHGKGVRMVVWPETLVQVPLNMAPDHPLFTPRGRAMVENVLGYLRKLGAEMDCYFLIGAPTYYPRGAGYVKDLRYGIDVKDFGNSALMFSPQGEFLERYDKIRLVPFGEYIPLRELLPFLGAFTPMSRELTPGDQEVIFALPRRQGGETVRFGALICYEDVFAELTASFRRKGAEFLVNLTDEGWYHIRGELGQHLAMAVFRAVETRTTVVRAANTGISCFINPRGEVYAALPPLQEGALQAPVQLCDRLTPYVRYGDTFGVSCLMLAIALPPLLIILRRQETATEEGIRH